MKNIKNEILSTLIGLAFIAFGFKILYDLDFEIDFEDNYFYLFIGLEVFGVLLLFARDKLVDILTLGISNLTGRVSSRSLKSSIGGDKPKSDKDEKRP